MIVVFRMLVSMVSGLQVVEDYWLVSVQAPFKSTMMILPSVFWHVADSPVNNSKIQPAGKIQLSMACKFSLTGSKVSEPRADNLGQKTQVHLPVVFSSFQVFSPFHV